MASGILMLPAFAPPKYPLGLLRGCVPRLEATPKPVVDMHIVIVALAIRVKASLQASAGGQFDMRSVRTEVAASIVKSTSSRVRCDRTAGLCHNA